MRLALDIDGVLARFTDSYAHFLTRETGIAFPRASEDFPQEWFWERAMGVTPEQEAKVWTERILQPGSKFWYKLHPMDGAGGIIRRLNDLTRVGHEVFFLTHRMGDKAKLQTERWLYSYGMNFPTVLLSGEKVPLIQALGVTFFIDDKPSTVVEAAEVMEKVYLMNAPYNVREEMPPNVVRVRSAEEALMKEGLW